MIIECRAIKSVRVDNYGKILIEVFDYDFTNIEADNFDFILDKIPNKDILKFYKKYK